MSSKNDDNGWILPAALIFTAVWAIIVLIYAMAVFLSLLLTVVAIFAWNKPVNLFGAIAEPAHARAFVGGGLFGMIALPTFVGFCVLVLQIEVAEWAWLHFFLGGYALGSLGINALIDGQPDAAQPDQVVLPPLQEAPDIKPAQQTKDYPFADWLDADEFR